nr:M23 family metallopeptidase [Salirhabdus salicampi]
MNLTVSQDISYIPEITFQPSYDNEEVLAALDGQVSYAIEGVKLEVDGELIGYFKDRENAENALKQFKTKYVPEDILEKFEDPDYSPEEEKKVLSNGNSAILDISFSGEVSITKDKVRPHDLLTVEQGVKLLERGTLTDKIHKIQSGEVLGTIASKYDLSMNDLLNMNPDLHQNSILQIGQEVVVTGRKPHIDVIVEEEKVEQQSISYQTVYENTDSLYKGQTKVKTQGKEGMKEVHYRLTIENGEVINREVIKEEVLREPITKVILRGTKVIPSRGTGDWAWPTAGGTVTSKMGWRWGQMHNGIDIAGVSNRSIYAADNGTVTYAGWRGGYGNHVVINHNNGYETSYSHLSSINVTPGQTVKKGQKIGMMGSTGNSTGVHLHFEVKRYGSNINPLGLY